MKNLIVIFILFIFISCSTTKYVEVPVEHNKIEYRDKIKYDSIYIKDSIIHKNNKDTVYLEKYKYLYKYIIQKDTVNIIDSIPIVTIQEVTKEVNKLYKWQIILMVLGGVVLVNVGYKIIRVIRI